MQSMGLSHLSLIAVVSSLRLLRMISSAATW
nr:MAG TPA: hypothetical protein [Caudoviricetes sp.]DAV03026.1 MAG TPA: hypothetical protein [Caudoviricetes sp.]